MHMPIFFVKAMLADGQALIWEKDFVPNKDEFGSDLNKKRWVKERAMSGKTRTHLGIGLLDWKQHLKGLMSRWIQRYLDASRGESGRVERDRNDT